MWWIQFGIEAIQMRQYQNEYAYWLDWDTAAVHAEEFVGCGLSADSMQQQILPYASVKRLLDTINGWRSIADKDLA